MLAAHRIGLDRMANCLLLWGVKTNGVGVLVGHETRSARQASRDVSARFCFLEVFLGLTVSFLIAKMRASQIWLDSSAG